MSHHFTYVIDEHNLRVQLKEFSVPMKDDSWQKFETYSKTLVGNKREDNFKTFNFNINPNVVLPAVFGAIVILFSFLLVNFISINDTPKASEQKADVTPVSPTEIKPIQAPKETQQVVIDTKQEENTHLEEVKPNEEVKPLTLQRNENSTSPELKKPSITSVEQKTLVEQSVTLSQANVATLTEPEASADSATSSTVANSAELNKKKSKRRSEAVEAQALLDIRPTLISEESDSETRPD